MNMAHFVSTFVKQSRFFDLLNDRIKTVSLVIGAGYHQIMALCESRMYFQWQNLSHA